MSEQASPAGGMTPPETYERWLVPAIFRLWTAELLAAAAVRPGERVLDVACGTGIVARQLAERFGGEVEVTGLDIAPGMLAVARQVAGGLPITWVEASALEMPFADGCFDVLLCQQGVQFFPDRLAGLREMRRVLAPGGRALLLVHRNVEHAPGFAAVRAALERQLGPEAAVLPPFSLTDAAQLQQLMAEAGFRSVELSVRDIVPRFPSAREFVRRIATGAPSMLGALGTASEAEKAAISEDVAAALTAYEDEDGLAAPISSHLAIGRA